MLLVLLLTATTAWAGDFWGSGTAADPYQISTPQQWKRFAYMVNAENGTYGDKCYKLTNDITVTGSWSDDEEVFVGDVASCAFRGTFDGGGKTLTFNFQTIYDGGAPFKHISGATISNLHVAGQVNVSGGINAAGIAGYAWGSSTISGCTVGSILQSSSNGSGCHGGLVGIVESGATLTISDCTFNGSFTGSVELRCGGFVGYNLGTVSITDCLFDPSTVSIEAKYLYSFCNDLSGSSTLTRAYRTFDNDSDQECNQGTRVYTEVPTTTLARRMTFGGNTYYADGGAAITGVNDAYGLAGSSLDLPTAGVTFDGTALAAANYEVVFRNSSSTVVNRLDAAGTYTVTATGKGDYAGSVSKTFTVTKGDGSQEHPYLIGTPEEWDDFAAQVTGGNSYSGKYVRLTADISVSTMAGDDSHSFNGTFLGGGHTLTVDISGGNKPYIAPFRSVNGATISDLTVAGSVTSGRPYAATLVGASNGSTHITNCHSTATLNCTWNGFSCDGGFVGQNGGTLTFERCSFKGRLLGAQTYMCGGFVGWNQNATATFTDCLFAPAEVTMGTDGSGTFVRPGSGSTTTFTRTYYTTGFGAEQGVKVTAEAPDGICKAVTSAADGATYYDQVCSVSGIDAIYPLGADPVQPKPVVKDGSTTLSEDVDYVLHWDEERAAEGDYTLTVAGIGNYTGAAIVGYRVSSSTGTFGGQTFIKGTDGEGDYFVIATGQDLRNLASAVNAGNTAGGVRFVQTADIDLSSGGNFTPIGGLYNNGHDRFYATYDGGHHTISGLTVESGGYAGLFGYVYNGTVRNVRLVSPSIKSWSTSADVGTISATMIGSTVENCLVISPSVSGGNAGYRGTIVGNKDGGTCRNCYFYGGNQDNAFGNGGGTNVSRVYKATLSNSLDVATAYTGNGTDANGARIGSGTHAGYYAPEGTTVTLAAPDGCTITSASYNDGSDHTLTADANGKYAFTMPDKDVAVTATILDLALFGSGDDPLVDGSVDHPYVISTTAGWNQLCDLLAENGQGFFTDKTVKLGADISVTRMAGSEGHEFTGTFDGDGHTLTVSYGSANQRISEEYAAPFRYAGGFYIDGNHYSCTIKNLRVAGTIYTSAQFAAGFVGFNNTNGYITLENCRSSVVINSSVSGDGTHGGFVARRKGLYTLYIRGCLFDGEFHGSNTTKWGGFVGYRNSGDIYMYHSIFAPTALEIDKTESATFIRNGINNYFRCYYTEDINDGEHYTGQGHRMRSITPGTDVIVGLNDSPAKYYEVSHITNYGSIYSSDPGLKYGDTYYAGSGEVVSVTLGTNRTGYVATSYSASNGGTISGNATDGWTLTMPDADVTVSATFAPDPEHFAVSGNEYTIKTAAGWGVFCDALQDLDTYNRFSGKTVYLTANIGSAESPVTRMAGSANHDFCGTFDGGGHTITLAIGSAENPFGEEYAALFRNVTTAKANPSDAADSPACIHSLVVDGHIYTSQKYAAGIVGNQYGKVSIENCHVSTIIHSSKNDDGTHGGIVANQHGGALTIEGCIYDGRLLTTNGTNECGGLVGYHSGGTCTISNSLYAPTDCTLAQGESYITDGATICRNYSGTPANCYYTRTLGTAQGLGYSFTTAPSNIGTAGEAYSVSGITPYTRGLLYGGHYYMTPEAVSLADNATNDVAAINGYFADVTLQGRTLYKDGDWNTLCLPFAMTAGQVAEQLAPTKLMTLSSSTFSGGELTLTFEDASTIEAGKPYIIKWENTEGTEPTEDTELKNPVFQGVTIPSGYTSSEAITEGLAEASSSTDYVDFIGTFSPEGIYEEGTEKHNLYLGADNKLYYPTAEEFKVNACRAWFQLKNGLTCGTPSGNGVRSFVLNFDGDATGVRLIDNGELIMDHEAGAWYDLSGRRVSVPSASSANSVLPKGVYIHNGKKVVVK